MAAISDLLRFAVGCLIAAVLYASVLLALDRLLTRLSSHVVVQSAVIVCRSAVIAAHLAVVYLVVRQRIRHAGGR
jgi:uncharacterized membrane protein